MLLCCAMQMNVWHFSGIAFFVVLLSIVEAYSNGGSSSSYHLISLPEINDYSSLVSSPTLTVPQQPQSIRDLWRWKDDVLGNGHDFFTPRPRAIQSLISLFVGQTFITTTNTTSTNTICQQQQCWKIEECAILSNCARLDIYLLCKSNSTTLPDTFPSLSCSSLPNINTCPKSIVANILASQLLEQYQKNKKKSYYKSYIKDSISAILDRPDVIIRPMRPKDDVDGVDDISSTATQLLLGKLQGELNDNLLEILGVEAILRHTCLVACGMAVRPNRPNRQVIFQPFSSRDAHILLQLKRTVDITHGSQLKRLLQASLSVGKAARDVRIVPQILPLRMMKHGTTTTTTTTTTIDRHSIDIATSAVRSVVLEPAIHKFLVDIQSRENSSLLCNLRQRLEQMVMDAGGNRRDMQQLHKILHLPTVALREGREINEEEILQSVTRMLKERGLNDSTPLK